MKLNLKKKGLILSKKINTISECQCNVCKNACRRCPGWFMPGEAEKVAEYLSLPFNEFFKQYLGVNWWVSGPDEDDIFILAPAIISMTPGQEYPFDPQGQCIFFKNNLCEIHTVKPYECKHYIHTTKKSDLTMYKKIANAWKNHNIQIVKLLNRKPISKQGTLYDIFSLTI